ncbi:MAG: hypothetical protein Hens3KO_17640 [Henriciella sp.]
MQPELKELEQRAKEIAEKLRQDLDTEEIKNVAVQSAMRSDAAGTNGEDKEYIERLQKGEHLNDDFLA